MDPRLKLHHALENFRNHGCQVGGWTINPSEDAKIRGGMGTILIGQRRNMRNQLEYGAIKFQLPEGLPDGTLFNPSSFRIERNVPSSKATTTLQLRVSNSHGTSTLKISAL